MKGFVKVLKTVGIVFGVLILVLILLFVGLTIKGKIDEKKPFLADNYYEEFVTDSPLEEKYEQKGTYEVAYVEYESNVESIQKIEIWYPKELEENEERYPMIMVTNASNVKASKMVPFFERVASWGFIVVGNEDPQTGTGETTSITLDYMLNLESDSLLYNRIDTENIGLVGHSQGGAGAINAATQYNNSGMYKVMFTGSAAYAQLAKNLGWEYDISKVTIPYFMTAGTGTTDDSGKDMETDFGGVAPLQSVIDNYNGISDEITKVRARVTGAEHEDMLVKTDSYMLAWLMYYLQDDQEAGKVFFGDNPEIKNNSNWQDIEMNLME